MENYNVLTEELPTPHFYLVSFDNDDLTFGFDDILPTKADCDEYIVDMTHTITSGVFSRVDKGVIVVKEYNLTNEDIEWLEYDTQAFFDNREKFDDKYTIIETLKIGY